MGNNLREEFDFGSGIKFRLGGENNGDGVFYHEIIIDRNDFKNIMNRLLPSDDIESVIGSCIFFDVIHTANTCLESGIETFWIERRYWDEEDVFRAERMLSELEEFIGLEDERADCIRDAYERLSSKLKSELSRKKYKELSKIRRRDVNENYNSAFMFLGRRDGFQCQKCGKTTDLVIDHIFPLSKGGTNDTDNLQILCSMCNSKKSDSIE